MKIGLLSDSHGNLAYVKKAGQYLKEKFNVDLIIHLGDDYPDTGALQGLGVEILKVPGIFDSYYQDPDIPNRIIKDMGGIKVLITHSPVSHSSDLPQDKDPKVIIKEENIKAVFYGHTHVPKIENENAVVWINPGHLRESDNKGYAASFAVVEIKDCKITAKIIELLTLKEIMSLAATDVAA